MFSDNVIEVFKGHVFEKNIQEVLKALEKVLIFSSSKKLKSKISLHENNSGGYFNHTFTSDQGCPEICVTS